MQAVSRLTLWATALAFLSGCASTGPSPDQMVAGAKELDQRFCAAFSKADVDGIMASYWNSPDLVVYPPDELEEHGWQAVKDAYKKFMTPGAGKLELIDPDYRVAGEVVIGWGKWKMTMKGPDGKPMEMIGRYTQVSAQKDGKWVYILDHPSVPMQPPPLPGPAK